MKYLFLLLCLLCSSCSFSGEAQRPVEIKSGQIAELAEDANVYIYLNNTQSGKREKRKIKARAGWYIGRPVE